MVRTTLASATSVRHEARDAGTGVVLARSSAAVRIEAADEAPVLWFPRADLCLAGRERSVGRAGQGDLEDYVSFDADLVDLFVVETGHDERDVWVYRFPAWGDVQDLIQLLDVAPETELRYRSQGRFDRERPVVEGSQMLAQAIVASSRELPGRRAVSASMVFTRAADARVPYSILLDPITVGRTFGTFGVRAEQGGRTCAVGTVLLDSTAPDVVRHADPPPAVPGPYACAPYDMSVIGRDLRVVDDAYTNDSAAPIGPAELDAWVRFSEVPDDPPLHAALLAQFTGHMAIAAALRPHAGIGQDQAHRTLSTAINAISLSIHAEVHADEWMLYHHRATFAGDGMIHAECRVYDEPGALLASFTVEAMVRAFADPSKEADARTAL